MHRALWKVLTTSKWQEVGLIQLVLLQTLLRLHENALERAEFKFEFISQRFGVFLVDACDRQALCPRDRLLLASAFTGGSTGALMVVILVDQIPEPGGDVLVALRWQTVEGVRVLGPMVISWSSTSRQILASLDGFLMLTMDVLEVEVHVIKHLLLRHLEARERLLQMDDLGALAKKEFAEGTHLRTSEQYIPVHNWIWGIRQACHFELFDYVALHIRA